MAIRKFPDGTRIHIKGTRAAVGVVVGRDSVFEAYAIKYDDVKGIHPVKVHELELESEWLEGVEGR